MRKALNVIFVMVIFSVAMLVIQHNRSNSDPCVTDYSKRSTSHCEWTNSMNGIHTTPTKR